MLIQKFGIALRSIEESDLETIRSWRNQQHVRDNMQFTQQIDEQDQKRWYMALDKSKNLYFIFGSKTLEVGLVHLKNIDTEKGIAEAGIFVGLQTYLNSPISVAATVVLMDYAFENLHLNQLMAKIKLTNLPAIRFNVSLGYEFVKKHGKDFGYYKVTVANYKTASIKLRTVLNKLSTR